MPAGFNLKDAMTMPEPLNRMFLVWEWEARRRYHLANPERPPEPPPMVSTWCERNCPDRMVLINLYRGTP